MDEFCVRSIEETNYIEDRPGFDDLADLREQCQNCLSLIRSLAQEPDVAQRATDLHVGAWSFLEAVSELIHQED